jgi:membrane protease subunit HflK
VTRKRLYLETMESVMSRTGKVVVDSEGTGNLMYLPLDELFKRRVEPPRFSSPDEGEASSDDSGNDEALRPPRRTRETR